MYKIIAIDLDGTLLNKEKKISDENKAAIKEAQDLGIKVVIATGRPFKGFFHLVKELGLENTDNYIICFNGGLVYHLLTNTVIYSSSITGKELKKLYKESLELNVNIHAFRQNQDLVSPKISIHTQSEATLNNIEINIQDFNEIKEDELFIKGMLIDPKEILDEAISNLNKQWYEDFSVVRSTPVYLEFCNKNAQKGVALKALADHLNIDIKDTVAFGDAGNDYSMIKMAGLGVVMANGMDFVKEIADEITLSNEENGVAYGIRNFVIQKNCKEN
ncbi:MAG: Cof-type HAD-IIB family hydrolase [bacterium]